MVGGVHAWGEETWAQAWRRLLFDGLHGPGFLSRAGGREQAAGRAREPAGATPCTCCDRDLTSSSAPGDRAPPAAAPASAGAAPKPPAPPPTLTLERGGVSGGPGAAGGRGACGGCVLGPHSSTPPRSPAPMQRLEAVRAREGEPANEIVTAQRTWRGAHSATRCGSSRPGCISARVCLSCAVHVPGQQPDITIMLPIAGWLHCRHHWNCEHHARAGRAHEKTCVASRRALPVAFQPMQHPPNIHWLHCDVPI